MGAYARSIPAANGPPMTAAGLSDTPPKGWPPNVLYPDCTPGQDEVAQFEKALGVTSVGCPFQEAAVAGVSTQGAASSPAAPPKGYNVYCYQKQDALIAVEFSQVFGDATTGCTHIVGLGVYHAQTPQGGK